MKIGDSNSKEIKNSPESIQKIELVEISEESVQKEIESSIDSFKNEDKKVVQIEQSINLEDKGDVEEVKNELQLGEKLDDLNKQADELKDETLEEKESPADKAEEMYQAEVLPILEILKPDGVSMEDYEDQTMSSLMDDVKKMQMSQGIMLQNPEETVKEIKKFLDLKVRKVLEDSHDYEKRKKMDAELIKKAKIVLLAEGDFSNIQTYSLNNYTPEKMDIRDLRDYIVGGSGYENKFTESDLESLMKTSYRESLISSSDSDYLGRYGACESIPESLLIALAEDDKNSRGNRYYPINNALENADIGKYDKKLFQKLFQHNYGIYAVENFDKFKEVDLESLYKSEEIYKNKMETAIDSINRAISIDKKQKSEIQSKLLASYLENGTMYNIEKVIPKLNIDDEDRVNEELQEKTLDGLVKQISSSSYSSEYYTAMLQEYLDIPEKSFQTVEFKTKIMEAITHRSSLRAFNSFTKSDNEFLAEKVGLTQEEYKKAIHDAIPRAGTLDSRSFLNFLQMNNIGEDAVSSEEIRSKILGEFQETIQQSNLYEALSMVRSFPFLQDHVGGNLTVRDMIFERMRDRDLGENKEIKEKSSKNIQESFWVSEKREKLPLEIKETLNKFENQYGTKGKDLIALAISAYGTENPENFKQKMEKIEEVLNKYDPDTIPDGAKVSMGIEYEVTNSVAEEYQKGSLLGYKTDIEYISESANIGKGTGGIHEIATRPNYNPYMIMAEIKLMQDAGLLDLNFERYTKAPRGYHLSLGGDTGLQVDGDMFFLHNTMTMSQLTGINAGKEVRLAKGIHEKGLHDFSNVKQGGIRCEIKGMATDSVEQFEKSIITAHHAGIAIQLSNKYLPGVMQLGQVPSSAKDFEKMLKDTGSLSMDFESDQDRDIVYEWFKLKRSTIDAVGEHNKSFVDSEFNGSFVNKDGEYIDHTDNIDVAQNRKRIEETELNSEEFKDKLKINIIDLFESQKLQFVNTLAKINDVFLKPPAGDFNSPVNAGAVLNTMKKENYGGIVDGKPQESIFERGGEFRDGYYYVQGASEEMITHKTQILLNHFNKNMEKLLQNKGVKRNVNQEELVTT